MKPSSAYRTSKTPRVLFITSFIHILTLDLVDGLGQATNVVAGDTGDTDTAVLGGVHAVLLGKGVHLSGLKTSVGEHANLAGDVAPVVLAAKLLKVLLEQSTHADDAVGHLLDLGEPLLVQGRVIQDLGGNAGTVDGRVGVQRADEDLDLRVDSLLLVGVLGDNGEGTDALTVETHVLGEGLGQADVVALLDEVADGKGILVGVARGETLVGHVEEGVVASLLDGIADLPPLSLGRVDTSGVVGASVEQEDAALGGSLDVGEHALEVKTDGLRVIVPVLLDLEAGVLEDGAVVGPRGVGDVDLLGAGVESLEEGSTDPEGTSTRDGLGNDKTVEGRRVLAVGEDGGSLGEVGETGDAGVLLVQLVGNDLVLGSTDRGEDVRLALVVTVSADT